MAHKQAPWSFIEQYYLDDLAERDSHESRFYLSLLESVKGKSVLSLGCGPNLYDDVQFFANIPKEVVGIDLNRNNIEFLKKSRNLNLLQAKQFLKKHHVKSELIVGNILKPRKAFQNRFDAVYAMGVIGMFRERQIKGLLKLIHGYLKPNGIFLDIDWTDCQLSKEKYKEREGYEWYSRQGPTIKRLAELFNEAEFRTIKQCAHHVPDKQAYGWGKIYGIAAKKNRMCPPCSPTAVICI